MKIQLPDTNYTYLSDNSSECNANDAFLQTKLNEKYLDDIKQKNILILKPDDIKHYFGLDKIKIVGITGTNGKTTTAAIIYSILLDLGIKVAMQGTRGFYINEQKSEEKTLTTPTLLHTYTNIYQAVQAECEYFIMEVSSHAIVQKRDEGIKYALKIHTNITQDHLDYHKTLEEYINIKNSFFADESMKLVNRDDPKIDFNFKNAFSYALESGASFKLLAYSLTSGISGMIQHFDEVEEFISPLYGHFNLYNITAAISAVKLLTKKPLREICDLVENFYGVSGRMEVVSKIPMVIVDFAHTPDGMKEVMNSLREKDILVVFGAGGDRDKIKRPLMGKIAGLLAKKVYLTSDNPRNEDPDTIIDDIYKGIDDKSKVIIDVNRKSAIKKALKAQGGNDVVLILGKGDETYQIIYDKKLPFDDREVVRKILKD